VRVRRVFKDCGNSDSVDVAPIRPGQALARLPCTLNALRVGVCSPNNN
jgi:hypothetical protein